MRKTYFQLSGTPAVTGQRVVQPQDAENKCANCGMTIAHVTYGRYGSKPLVIWKHVGNRWQSTSCTHPEPKLRLNKLSAV